MEIEQYVWGSSPEGEGILLYIMRSSDGCEVRLTNAGASVAGIRRSQGDETWLTPRFETPGQLLGDCAGCGRTFLGERYGFDRKLWQSRIETNRIVMWLDAGDRGEPPMETIFDFDDERLLCITHQALGCGSDLPVDLHTRIFWNGTPRVVLSDGKEVAAGETVGVPGWRKNILGEVATLTGKPAPDIAIRSSQPELQIVRNGNTTAAIPFDSRPAPLADGALYCQKTAYLIG